MNDMVSLDVANGIIVLTSRDKITPEDLYETLNKVCEYTSTHGYKKILVNASNQKTLPSVDDLYQFVTLMSQKTIGSKQAIVVSENTTSDIAFLENVAFRKGTHIKRFFSFDEAVAWLNQ
jgi:hypothetical protein